MGRVINTETAGKERTQLTRAVVIALRELIKKGEIDQETRDLAAFIAIALAAIAATIDVSVAAWEKRDYWVKADRFRMEWAWSDSLGQALKTALLSEDWPGAARISAQVMQKLKDAQVPQRHKLGTPWVGAWERLISEER